MSGLVKDIFERSPSASSSSKTPVAPKPPSLSQSNGFPSVTHRSLKPPSAFVRARQERERQAQLKASGKLPQDGKVPVIQTAEDSEDEEKPAELDEKQNLEKVAAMTLEEREQEKAELLERFGGSLVSLMEKRKATREGKKAIKASPPRALGAEDLRQGRTVASDERQNEERVASMTPAKREQEKAELLERFGGNLTDVMQRRKEARQRQTGRQDFQASSPVVPKQEAMRAAEARQVRFAAASEPEEVPRIDPSLALPGDEDPYSPANIHRTYFPTTTHDATKLEWMRAPAASASEDASVRFDFSGQALDKAQAEKLPAHLGLHHHGSSPDLAGYTLKDIYHLCLSTVPSQRVTMLDVLAKVVGRYMLGNLSDEARQACSKEAVAAQAVELSCGVLAGLEKNSNVVRVAVGLLYEGTGGSLWSQGDLLDRTAAARYPSFVVTGPGEDQDLLADVPFEVLVGRLTRLLALNQPDVSALTTHQLLRILRRAVIHSESVADTVCPLVPIAVATHLMGATNPQLDARPSLEALLLLRDITTSSRACAEALVAQNVYEPLVRFVATYLSDASNADEDAALRRDLCINVLATFTALGRYGLLASITATGAEIWRDLGGHVVKSLGDLTKENQAVAIAYFQACAVWITCAIDPHRIVPDHDVTWAQVTAMGWAEEALDAVEITLGETAASAMCAAALRMVGFWLRGSKVNEPLAGEAQRTMVSDRLAHKALLEALMSALQSGHHDIATAVLEVINALGNIAVGQEILKRLHSTFAGLLRAMEADYPGGIDERKPRVQLALAMSKFLRPVKTGSNVPPSALQLMRHFTPGDEPAALDLLDDLLRHEWAVEDIASIGYKDGLMLLRPLLQYTILPDVTRLVGPATPHPVYLKNTATLRSPESLERVMLPAEQTTGPPKPVVGLPLPADWLFSPLSELLQSGTSQSLSQVPPGWDASEVEITRATLVFAALFDPDAIGDRSSILLNLMKVYMLEHGQQNSPNPHASEVFRDSAVSAALAKLMRPLLYRNQSSSSDAPRTITLEDAALPFLGAGVPFFQFFVDFIALFEAMSLSDTVFTQLVLPALSQRYPIDYRKHIWCDQPTALRSVRLAIEDVPVETSVRDYFYPLEAEADILAGYTRALINKWVTSLTHPFMYQLALHHLGSYIWSNDCVHGVRDSLLKAVFMSAPLSVLQDLTAYTGDGSTNAINLKLTATAEVQQSRRQLADVITGGRASQRLAAVA